MHALLLLAQLCLAADLAAPPATPEQAALKACEAAFNSHDMEASLSCFGDNGAMTLIVDPTVAGATPEMPDAVFRGKDALREFLEIYLPGLVLTPTEGGKARLESKALRELGVASATITREATALGPKLQSLSWRFDPETRATLLRAIPSSNKNVVRRFYDGINKGDRTVFDTAISPNFIQHTVMAAGPGRAGLKAFYEEFWKAFPNGQFVIEDMFADGDRVAVRITGRYVHKGTFLGIAPTGKAVVLPRIAIFRLWGGRTMEHWDQADRYGLLQQLGAAPTMPSWTSSPGYEGFH